MPRTHSRTGKSIQEEDEIEARRTNWRGPSRSNVRSATRVDVPYIVLRRGRKFCWGFVTKDIAEYSSRRYYLRIFVRDAIIYFMFVLLLNLRSYYFKKPENHLLHQNFRTKFILQKFLVDNKTKETTFENIQTVSEIWTYLDDVVLSRLYDGDYYDVGKNQIRTPSRKDKMIMYHNRMLGVPRIRQQRTHNQSCKIHSRFQTTFKRCYWDITDEKLKQKNYLPDLQYRYQNSTNSPPYRGIAAIYQDGGYVDFFDPAKTTTTNKLKILRKNSFIRTSTRFIILNFSYYNANFDSICVCALMFELPRIGGVWTKFFHVALYLRFEMNLAAIMYNAAKTINLTFILFYSFQTFTELWFFKVKALLRFTTYLDVAHVIAGVSCIIYQVMYLIQANQTIIKRNKIDLASKDYVNLEWLMHYYMYFKESYGLYLFLSYLKVFKFLGFNKTMNQLKNTLKKSTSDILNFSVMFLVIFVGFAEMFHLLFGMNVNDFRKFTIAMFALVRTIFGDFNYEPVSQSGEFLAPIIFVFYVFFIFFVLLNMFMAIITESFIDVKTETAIAPEEYEVAHYISEKFKDFLVCLRLRKKKQAGGFELRTDAVIELLRDLGFTSEQIEKFVKKYQSESNAAIIDMHRMQADVAEHAQVYRAKDITPQKISAEEYMEFQERIEAVETSVEEVAEQAALLIRRLDTLRNVQKTPRYL